MSNVKMISIVGVSDPKIRSVIQSIYSELQSISSRISAIESSISVKVNRVNRMSSSNGTGSAG